MEANTNMSYPGECKLTQTPDERRAEADRIIKIMIENDCDCGNMTQREQEFFEKMVDHSELVSPKQLLWLRDLKGKYAE